MDTAGGFWCGFRRFRNFRCLARAEDFCRGRNWTLELHSGSGMGYFTMRILSILLFLGLATVFANAETCPSPEETEPCSCKEDVSTGEILFSCRGDSITLGELKKALNSLSQKDDVEIDLHNLNLGKIPSDFFYGIAVKTLEIFHCKLDNLQGEDGRPPLLGLENTLERLLIVNSLSEHNSPAKLKLGHLRKLKRLYISYNSITELSDDWFDRGPATLEDLIVLGNGIEKVGDRVFANLINLKHLFFASNRFGPLKRSMLPSPAQSLVSLQLVNNSLTSIPEDIFKDMPSLTFISFNTNRIKRLEQRTWQPVWQQFDYIRLEENPLECDSNLNWMFNLKVTSNIYGQCEAPREREGLSLKDFIDRKGF